MKNQLLKDEVTVLREQLASTSSQLAASRFPSNGGMASPWNVPGGQAQPGAGPSAGDPLQPGGTPRVHGWDAIVSSRERSGGDARGHGAARRARH